MAQRLSAVRLPVSWLGRAYRTELPRLLRELRWLILFMALVQVAGTAVAHYGTVPGYWGIAEMRYGHAPSGLPSMRFSRYFGSLMLREEPPVWDQLVSRMFPLTDTSTWGHGWPGYFIPNALRSCYHLVWGSVTFGLVSVRSAWDCGWSYAWRRADALAMAHSASGLGTVGALVALAMPYGIFQMPAFWLIWALALRTGLVWVWQVPGLSRTASVWRQVRRFPVALAVAFPALLVSALLETYVTPTVLDRYFCGIGLSAGMAEEARMVAAGRGRSDALAEVSISPNGRMLAFTDADQKHLLQANRDGSHCRSLLQRDTLISPTWSPDSSEIAVVWSPYEESGRLIVVSPKAAKQHTITGGPPGRYLGAAWSHHGDTIAVVTQSPSREPGGYDHGPTTMWLVGATSSRWTKLTTLRADSRVAITPGLTWHPDDEEIAFARLAGGRRGTQIWAVRVADGHLRQVSKGATDALPSWSPDGEWIAFVSRPPGGDTDRSGGVLQGSPHKLGEIGLVRPDGTGRIDHIAKVDPYAPITWLDSSHLLYCRHSSLIRGRARALADAHSGPGS